MVDVVDVEVVLVEVDVKTDMDVGKLYARYARIADSLAISTGSDTTMKRTQIWTQHCLMRRFP